MLFRSAMRYPKGDTNETFCIALYGNDGYERQEGEDSDPVIHARTRACVDNLYAGLANLVPEGMVEFGTSGDDGFTWVILVNFPRHDEHGDFRGEAADQEGEEGDCDDEEDDDEDADNCHEGDDPLVGFWDNMVWEQWKSQLAFMKK